MSSSHQSIDFHPSDYQLPISGMPGTYKPYHSNRNDQGIIDDLPSVLSSTETENSSDIYIRGSFDSLYYDWSFDTKSVDSYGPNGIKVIADGQRIIVKKFLNHSAEYP